jgi:peptidoglycan/LPS O-acetylase OafA/YrhL
MPVPRSSLAPLTSVRFLAALRVALYHFVAWDDKTFWWRGLMATPVSVSYFFVSSGFLLAYNYSDRVDRGEMNYARFFLGRCARLLPVYFLGLLVALPLMFWHSLSFSPGKAVLTVLLLQAWSPSAALYWNGPAWALSSLAFFYVSLPVLLILTRSSSKRACLLFAMLAWILSVGLSLVYVHLNPDGLQEISSRSTGFWLYILKYNPLVRMPDFFIGVMAGRLYLLTGGFRRQNSTAVLVFSGLLLLAMLLLGNRIPYPVINSGLLAPLLALVVSALASGGFAAHLFEPRWFVLLGQSSYCLYMLHVPLWNLAHEVSAPYWKMTHAGEFALVLWILLLSLVLHKWVELPATTALRSSLVRVSASIAER